MIGKKGFFIFACKYIVVLWVVSYPALPASDNNLPVRQFYGSSPWNSCEIGMEALDAIYEATRKYVIGGNKDSAAWELIKEADKAGSFPECDSVRAKILAKKAIGLMSSVDVQKILDKEPLIQYEQGSDSYQESCVVSRYMEKKIFQAYDLVSEKNSGATDLVYEAYAIAGPPECDSTKANFLIGIATEHAIRMSAAKASRAIDSAGIYYPEDAAQNTPSNDRFSIYIEGGVGMGSEKLNPKHSQCIPPGCDTGLALGEGLHLAVGFQNFIGDNKSKSLSLALGYLTSASTDEKASAVTLEAMYAQHHGLHRLGFGLSYHLNPKYEIEIDDSRTSQVDFDDSLGIVFKWQYLFKQPNWHLGVGYTIMDYKKDGRDFDASRLEVYASKSYQ